MDVPFSLYTLSPPCSQSLPQPSLFHNCIADALIGNSLGPRSIPPSLFDLQQSGDCMDEKKDAAAAASVAATAVGPMRAPLEIGTRSFCPERSLRASR
jgi:hypothetical protein